MRLLIPLLLLFSLLPVLAQEAAPAEGRVLRLEFSDGVTSGNIRYGPLTYEHPDPDGITATVSTLTILSGRVSLSVPADQQGELLLADAEGSREAVFEGGVTVLRGRLEAGGPELLYSEATGIGTLMDDARIVISAREEGDDDVLISAREVEFDVDTDLSVSRGDVLLENGAQTASAAELTYAEELSLGVLRGEGG